MILYFADRQMNIIGQASTHLPDGLTVTKDKKTEDVSLGIAIFECTIPFEHSTQKLVKRCAEVGNYLLRSTGDENEFYTIIDCETDSKKQTVYIYAEDAGMDLINEVVGEYEADKAYNIAHYIGLYIGNSGFKIGVNEVSKDTKKLLFDNEQTASERIIKIAEEFDCEVSFSFEVKGLNVINKFINIYKERGKDVGAQLRLNSDIDGIITTKSIANLATALKCKGDTPDDEDTSDDVEPVPVTLAGYKYDDGDFYIDWACTKR